jgi:ParB-like nuclease domain
MTMLEESAPVKIDPAESNDEVFVIPIESLQPADSPRLSGEDKEHTQRLVETDAILPPILVHRTTMRVIDGMHRLHAAVLKGRRTIEVRFFDGTEEDAFIRSVETNVMHGLPLSLEDRRAAAVRIINSLPDMSDRAIAKSVGLADKTIGVIRRNRVSDTRQGEVRVGMDGRRYPVNGADGRRRAAEAIEANPTAPLREIAKAAGVSLGTAYNVRERLRRGMSPAGRADDKQSRSSVDDADQFPAAVKRTASTKVGEKEYRSRVERLQRDPSLRFSDMGKELLRWLIVQHSVEKRHSRVTEAVPPHLVVVVEEMALHCAEMWHQFASELHDREHGTSDA